MKSLRLVPAAGGAGRQLPHRSSITPVSPCIEDHVLVVGEVRLERVRHGAEAQEVVERLGRRRWSWPIASISAKELEAAPTMKANMKMPKPEQMTVYMVSAASRARCRSRS